MQKLNKMQICKEIKKNVKGTKSKSLDAAIALVYIYRTRANSTRGLLKVVEILVRVLNESGFYLSAGCIFSFFVFWQFQKLKMQF